MKKGENLKKDESIASEMVGNDVLKAYVLPLVIGFLVPGAGNLYIGDKKRGMFIFIILFITFFSVPLMHGKIYTPSMDGTGWDKMVSLLASIGELGNGVYYFGTLLFADTAGDMASVFYEAGSVYGITSGLLNFLVLFSLFDLIRSNRSNGVDNNSSSTGAIKGK